MAELVPNAEMPITKAEWSYDTLRVYLLSHIIAAQHTQEANMVLTREMMSHNDSRYMVLFASADSAYTALREVVHLKDVKYELQFTSLDAALQAQLLAFKENTALAFTASEKAIDKANEAAEKRFESVNEFRQTLTDQTSTFMPRAQVEALLKAVNDKVDAAVNRLNLGEGKSTGLRDGWGYIVGAIGIGVAIMEAFRR
jgi:hypothetical protein